MALPVAPGAGPIDLSPGSGGSAAGASPGPEASPRSGTIGVLLSHGFTGSPVSIRPWAEHLAAAGLRVVAPRLPGHGTTWQLMNRTGWQDWYAVVERAYLRLRDECEVVVVGGQSMGGCLALRIAEDYGSGVAGVVLVNPSLCDPNPQLLALPLMRRLVPSIPGRGNDIHRPGVGENAYHRFPLHALASLRRLWRTVGADLTKVDHPLLVFRSVQDHVVGPASVRLLRARVSSHEIEEHALPDSYHVATLDYDAPTVFAETVGFVERLGGRAGL